ncbi:ATP-binding protein [Niallia oryzisoli]|uniref:ATP-binding protein n=1 Tax=Niallia oryzisoli TaxID=1737571 RepID=UPI0037351FEC
MVIEQIKGFESKLSMRELDMQLQSEKHAVASQLAAGIAHEIRNPITAIKGFLQLIMADYKGKPMYFEVVEAEIARVEAILKELMVLGKPTKIKYEELPIDLLLDQVLTLMESHALLNNIEIVKRYELSELKVLGDEGQLKQVFINYIKNAIEAMPAGGTIFVDGCTVSKSSIQIKIIDQGCGIPSDMLERINEPFFTTKESGTGLGMHVSSQIIEEHQGKVTISSSNDGTCVEVILPAGRF